MNNIGLVKSSFIPRKDNSKKRLKIVQNNMVLCFELIFNHLLILKYSVFIKKFYYFCCILAFTKSMHS